MLIAKCTVTLFITKLSYFSAGKREEPYYSVVNIKRPDAIEMKQNDAYEKPAQLPLHVEENPAYSIGIQESQT